MAPSLTSPRTGGSRPRASLESVGALRAVAAIALIGACGGDEPLSADAGADAMAAPPICDGTYARVLDVGALGDAALIEASGLAASRRSPGVLWLHNDSGDVARLFAVDDHGQALARLRLVGVDAVDFEDLAAGPCPDDDGPCLWVADTGNNFFDRAQVAVYAVPEPIVAPGQDFVEIDATTVWRFPIEFAADPVDIEAMMLAADGQRLYFIEKNNLDRARIYRHPGPLVADQVQVLEELGDFASPGLAVNWGRAVTAADMHPSGARVLVRVYTAVYEYRFASGQGVADLDAIEPLLVAAGPLTEPQGESVAYDASGSGIFSVSEDPAGEPGQTLHFYACVP